MSFTQLMGHLGADAETRFTPSGQKVTTLRVAISVRRGGKEDTVWYRVTLWGDRFDKILPYLKKGSAVIVVGELGKPEIYTDREGKQQVSLEVTAEFIRFSPFGKGERSNTDSKESAIPPTPAVNPQRMSAGVAGGANHYTAPAMDDGLPF